MQKQFLTMFGLCAVLIGFSACATGKSTTKQPTSQMAGEALFDTTYVITAINGQTVPETMEKQPTMAFSWIDKRISGYAGCNRYFGTFTTEQGKIEFSKVGMTLMMCPDMPVEEACRTAIQATKTYRQQAGKLLLLDEQGTTVLTLQPAVAEK